MNPLIARILLTVAIKMKHYENLTEDQKKAFQEAVNKLPVSELQTGMEP
jgi:hypothetical protein